VDLIQLHAALSCTFDSIHIGRPPMETRGPQAGADVLGFNSRSAVLNRPQKYYLQKLNLAL
jgi:hypothetical protein